MRAKCPNDMRLELLTMRGLAKAVGHPKSNVHRLHAHGVVPHDFETDGELFLFDPTRVESLKAVIESNRKHSNEPQVIL